MSTKIMFFTIVGAVFALSPNSVFKRKYFKLLYQIYIVFWSFSVMFLQINVYFQRQKIVLLQKFIFVLLSVCKIGLDVSITITLLKRGPTLLKLLEYLIETWVYKVFLLWLFGTLTQVFLVLSIMTISNPIVFVFCFLLRYNGALIGVSLIVTLTKNRFKKFNLQVMKSREVDLPQLLQLQKKLFALIECLNCLFGAVVFWAVLSGVCLVLDYFSFTISKQEFETDYRNILGYYTEVMYFEVSDSS